MNSQRSRGVMRGMLPLLLLLALAAPAAAQRRVYGAYAVDPDGFVRIQNIAGSVKVTAWEKDSVVFSGMVHETPNERFEITRGDGGIRLGLWDTTVERVPPSNLEVRVPATAQVWVRTGSSSIFVGGVTGVVDVNSVSGVIEVTGAPRELTAESLSGEVVLETRTRTARVRTATGLVRLRGSYVDVNATSVSGSVSVETAGVERGRFESISGDIRYAADIGRGAVLDFVTHAGNVEFVLPQSVSVDFMVNTYEGELDNRFNVPVRHGGGKLKGRELGFTLGQGSGRAIVRTFKGRVLVRPL